MTLAPCLYGVMGACIIHLRDVPLGLSYTSFIPQKGPFQNVSGYKAAGLDAVIIFTDIL